MEAVVAEGGKADQLAEIEDVVAEDAVFVHGVGADGDAAAVVAAAGAAAVAAVVIEAAADTADIDKYGTESSGIAAEGQSSGVGEGGWRSATEPSTAAENPRAFEEEGEGLCRCPFHVYPGSLSCLELNLRSGACSYQAAKNVNRVDFVQ